MGDIETLQRSYRMGQWDAVTDGYRALVQRAPEQAREAAAALILAHAGLELLRDDALGQPLITSPKLTGVPAERVVITAISERARLLCRSGDFARASALLRLIAPYQPGIGATYAEAIDAAGAPWQGAGDSEPPIVAALNASPTRLAALRRVASELRVLVIARRYWRESAVPGQRCDVVDNLMASADALGITAFDMQPHWYITQTDYPEQLSAALGALQPHVILCDDLFEVSIPKGTSGDPDQLGMVCDILGHACQTYGTIVVNCFTDLWEAGEQDALKELGGLVDLVLDCHPSRSLAGLDWTDRRRLSYPFPYLLPDPGSPRLIKPGAAFAGSCSTFNIARAVWWAELGRLGLPFTFFETDYGDAAKFRSATDYARLLSEYQVTVSLTRRAHGRGILVGRTIETLVAGGCLFEEDCADTRLALTPGLHYRPFTTLADFQSGLTELLEHPATRQSLATAGHELALRAYTGDYFWLGLLDRLGMIDPV